MGLEKFLVEYVSDIQEKYPRVEITQRGDSFAFLDFSINENREIIINFWSKDSHVEIPFNKMEEFMDIAKKYRLSAVANVDRTDT